MQMIHCPNCGKLSGFKRSLGFGTFFMALLTLGLWVLVISFYPARCINCGLKRGSALVHAFRSWYWDLKWPGKLLVILSPALLILGFAAIGTLTKSVQPTASQDTLTTSSTNMDPAPAPSAAESNDHKLHLTPNLFGRGALSDGRTYSVTLIDSNKEQIPPATTLFVQGVILGRFDTDVIILADEQEKSDKILCAMNSDESEDVSYYYRAGEAVQITGSFGMSNLGVPVLRGCTVASATTNVVRPSHNAPEAEHPVQDTNARPEAPSADNSDDQSPTAPLPNN